MRPERHAFVRLAPGWRAGLVGSPCAVAAAQEIDDWRLAGRPFVVASAVAGDTDETVRLGLATPDKRRIGLAVAIDGIAGLVPAPLLTDVARCVPAPWRSPLQDLASRVGAMGGELRAYGSLAWQALTGLSYLRATSDADLLLRCANGDATARMLCAARLPMRLDGELLLRDGTAVSWREYAAQPAQILVKGHGGPWLRPFADVFARRTVA